MKTLSVIGCGNMGAAIVERCRDAYRVKVFDKDPAKTRALDGIVVASSVADACADADVILAAVKPQDARAMIADELGGSARGKLVISIAAGLTTVFFERVLPGCRVVRAMPNLPAKIAKGMVCLCAGASASVVDLLTAREIFERVGTVLEVKEEQMDAVTAISGSGPGFLFSLLVGKHRHDWDDFARSFFMPALHRAAQGVGFSPREATILSSTTTAGSLALLFETDADPAGLCAQVASKGGTTEAGLNALQGDIGNLEKAVRAAYDRARELSGL